MRHVPYTYEMSHVKLLKHTADIYSRSHTHASHLTGITQVVLTNESWHKKRRKHVCSTHEWVMVHWWMSHGTLMNKCFHTYEWAMSHVCEWVMSHIWSHISLVQSYLTAEAMSHTCSQTSHMKSYLIYEAGFRQWRQTSLMSVLSYRRSNVSHMQSYFRYDVTSHWGSHISCMKPYLHISLMEVISHLWSHISCMKPYLTQESHISLMEVISHLWSHISCMKPYLTQESHISLLDSYLIYEVTFRQRSHTSLMSVLSYC